MSRAIVPASFSQAMQIVWDTCRCDRCDGVGNFESEGYLIRCSECVGAGAAGSLPPEAVKWLANVALFHPQVGEEIRTTLPEAELRWALPWSWAWGDVYVRNAPDGRVVCRVNGVSRDLHGPRLWHYQILPDDGDTISPELTTWMDAYAEADERLLDDNWLLGGAGRRRQRPVCQVCAGAGGLPDWHGLSVTCPGCGGTGRHLPR